MEMAPDRTAWLGGEAVLSFPPDTTRLMGVETTEAFKESEWEMFIRGLYVWERRRLNSMNYAHGLSRELEWHDQFIKGKMDLIEIYAEIAEPRDYEAAKAAHEASTKPKIPLPE